MFHILLTSFLAGSTQNFFERYCPETLPYGKGPWPCRKILLHLEEDEAFTAQKYLSLLDEETMQIIRNGRGEALLCANKNKVCIEIKASPIMYDLITTKRSDLEKRQRI